MHWNNLDWTDWIRGVVAAFIGGGAGAVSAAFGVAISDPDHFNLSNPHRLIVAIWFTFLINGVITLAAFLRQKPVPDTVPAGSGGNGSGKS